MAGYILVTLWAWVSAVMLLLVFSRNIPVAAPERLFVICLDLAL